MDVILDIVLNTDPAFANFKSLFAVFQKPNPSAAKLSWKQRSESITMKYSERKQSFKRYGCVKMPSVHSR